MNPPAHIVPTQVIVKKYRQLLMRMIDCDYSIEKHLDEAIEVVRRSSNENMIHYLTEQTISSHYFTHPEDQEKYAEAFHGLVMELRDQFLRYGLFYNDEVPQLYAGMIGDDIVIKTLGVMSGESHIGT